MPNYNRVILAGHLTRDPETVYTPSGTAVCNFGLAVNGGSKQKPSTVFVEMKAFNKTAEVIIKYLRKGDASLFEGRLDFEQWATKEGVKRSKHSIIVDRVTMLGGGERRSERREEAATSWAEASFPEHAFEKMDDGGEIPF